MAITLSADCWYEISKVGVSQRAAIAWTILNSYLGPSCEAKFHLLL